MKAANADLDDADVTLLYYQTELTKLEADYTAANDTNTEAQDELANITASEDATGLEIFKA